MITDFKNQDFSKLLTEMVVNGQGPDLREVRKPKMPPVSAPMPAIDPADTATPAPKPGRRRGEAVPVLKKEPEPVPAPRRPRKPPVDPTGGAGGAGGPKFTLREMPNRYNEVVDIANGMLAAYKTDMEAVEKNLKPLIDDLISHGQAGIDHMKGLQHLNQEQKEHIGSLEKEARSRIKDLKKTLAPLKKQLAALQGDDTKDKEIERLGGVVKDKDAEIATRDKTIAARDKTIAGKDVELSDKDTKIADLTMRGKELTAKVKKLENDLEDKQDELEFTKAGYEEIVQWYSQKLKESDKLRRTVEREAARLQAELEQELDMAWVNPMKNFDRDHVQNYGRFDLKEHLEIAYGKSKGRKDFNW